MTVASGALAADFFSILALVIFRLKFLLKSASKSSFFLLWHRDPGLELQVATICVAVVRNSFVFCNSVFAAGSRMTLRQGSSLLQLQT